MRQHIVLRVVTKLAIPLILMFALYVQFHGDFGPGGGFQAGVILAAAFILFALVLSRSIWLFKLFPMLLAIVTMVTLENPHGTFATVASFIPPFTPFLMMARIASVPSPPTWQVWTTLLVMMLATYVAVRLAARVFRVGILLYGQPPSLRMIWRWMWTRD